MSSTFDDPTCSNAHIIELPAPVTDGKEPTAYERGGGDYFPVWLRSIPRVGDLIRLDARINAAKRQEPNRQYEVVRIMHVLEDVFEDSTNPVEQRGSHFVNVYVTLSADELFEDC